MFNGKGITDNRKANQDNLDGIKKTVTALKENTNGLIFTNLVDFDTVFGHRRDPEGYVGALKEFDSWLPEIKENLKDDEILIITADHGNDPTFKGTDHTREYIPIMITGKKVKQNIKKLKKILRYFRIRIHLPGSRTDIFFINVSQMKLYVRIAI